MGGWKAIQIDGIHKLLNEISSRESSDLLKKNNVDPSGKQLRLWKDLATRIIPLLDENNVHYTLMKAYDIPFAHMVDLDLLIEDKSDMIKTISILKKENYEFQKLRFFYPFKLTASKPGAPIIVDLYHKPKWYDFTYAPKGYISSSSTPGRIHGVDAIIPSPELNIYLVATHGYSHGRFTLEEILHLTNVVLKEKPDLLSLLPLARSFRTVHCLYSYMWLVRKILEKRFDYENDELELFLAKLQKNSLTRYFRRWIEHFSPFQYHDFPVQIPFKMLAHAGISKLPCNTLDPSVKRYDEIFIALRHFFFSRFLYSQIGQMLEKSS